MRYSQSGNEGRRGFSYLEAQVAFVVLAIALAGIGPLTVTLWKLAGRIEERQMSDHRLEASNERSRQTGKPEYHYYMIPPAEDWATKLGASATVVPLSAEPPPPSPLVLVPRNTVELSGPPDFTTDPDGVTVHITVK